MQGAPVQFVSACLHQGPPSSFYFPWQALEIQHKRPRNTGDSSRGHWELHQWQTLPPVVSFFFSLCVSTVTVPEPQDSMSSCSDGGRVDYFPKNKYKLSRIKILPAHPSLGFTWNKGMFCDLKMFGAFCSAILYPLSHAVGEGTSEHSHPFMLPKKPVTKPVAKPLSCMGMESFVCAPGAGAGHQVLQLARPLWSAQMINEEPSLPFSTGL